jgi:hypothetical protein
MASSETRVHVARSGAELQRGDAVASGVLRVDVLHGVCFGRWRGPPFPLFEALFLLAGTGPGYVHYQLPTSIISFNVNWLALLGVYFG